MAGIGVELRKILKRPTITGVLLATGYSAVLSSGNWIIAVGSIFLFSLLAYPFAPEKSWVIIYQVYITYAVALSLILSGPLQLMFTRYASDRIFEKELDRILPNFLGALILNMGFAFVVTFLVSLYLFAGLPYHYHLVFTFTVSVLSGLWLCNALLVGLKKYKHILLSFLLAYTFAGLAFSWAVHASLFLTFFFFYVSQFMLFSFLVYRVFSDYPSSRLLEFDFLNPKRSYYSLALTGLFYNLAIWADKFVFWFSPITGEAVFANIRTSVVYDIPVILAYLSLIPGIAVFFLKIEGEFAEYYEEYYKAVREWGQLEQLYRLAQKMVDSARTVFYDTLRVQAITDIFILFGVKPLFRLLKIPYLYIPLFTVLLIGATLQLAFMVIFALLSYFDRRRDLTYISLTFLVLNFTLSVLTQLLGPYFYGYGYLLSLLFSTALGMTFLRRFLHEVHYRTYMVRD
ncbi:MAG: exopolysaccharide Pel transporter PelG [Aquificae bacterium]|nr:exopolysaccharide Pel transporter PelG [Aquificota bacterium]